MGQLYMIPDRNRMEDSLKLAEDYHAAFEYNDFFNPAVLDDKKKVEELIAFYCRQPHDRTKDTMHGAFLDVTVHSEDPLIVQVSMHRTRQSMDIAQEMGLRGVVFHTGRLHGFRDKIYLEHWLNVNETFFRKILQEYPHQQIYMENMFDEAPDILAQLAARMQDEARFGVCLDYAHAQISGVEGEEWIRALAPYILHMHVNDNDKVNDLHQEVGTGKIDWGVFDRAIRQFGVEASVLVEMKDLERQRRSMEYMSQNRLYPFDAHADAEEVCR